MFEYKIINFDFVIIEAENIIKIYKGQKLPLRYRNLL